MSTEFLYREKDGGACGLEIYSLHVPGSFGGGPWTIRPKRLQWLNHTITTGFKIAAFLGGFPPRLRDVKSQFSHLKSVTPAKAGVQLHHGLKGPKLDASLRWHDRVRDVKLKLKHHADCAGLRPNLFFQNSDPGQSLAGAFPSILTLPCESGAPLR